MKARIILVLVALGLLIPILTGVLHVSLLAIRIVAGIVVVGCILYVVIQQSRRKP